MVWTVNYLSNKCKKMLSLTIMGLPKAEDTGELDVAVVVLIILFQRSWPIVDQSHLNFTVSMLIDTAYQACMGNTRN